MDILKILHNDLTELSDEERDYALDFTDRLKDKLIEELVEYEANNLISKLKSDKEIFIDAIENIYVNGIKGYNKLTIQLLINIYLEKIGEERFINAIEGVNN